MFLVVSLAALAVPLSHRRGDGVLRAVLRNPLLRSLPREHLRDALLPDVPPRSGNDDTGHRLWLATNTLYGLLQQQSLLLGLKTLLGYLVIATLLLAIVSRFIPFHKTVKVDVVRTGDDMG